MLVGVLVGPQVLARERDALLLYANSLEAKLSRVRLVPTPSASQLCLTDVPHVSHVLQEVCLRAITTADRILRKHWQAPVCRAFMRWAVATRDPPAAAAMNGHGAGHGAPRDDALAVGPSKAAHSRVEDLTRRLEEQFEANKALRSAKQEELEAVDKRVRIAA